MDEDQREVCSVVLRDLILNVHLVHHNVVFVAKVEKTSLVAIDDRVT